MRREARAWPGGRTGQCGKGCGRWYPPRAAAVTLHTRSQKALGERREVLPTRSSGLQVGKLRHSSEAAGSGPTASVGKGWCWKVSLRPDVGTSEICDLVPAPRPDL